MENINVIEKEMNAKSATILREIREKFGLSRREFVLKVGLDRVGIETDFDLNSPDREAAIESAIERLKRAETRNTKQALSIIRLATVALDFSFMVDSGDTTILYGGKKMVTNLISLMDEKDLNAPRTVQYDGVEDVINAWVNWVNEFESRTDWLTGNLSNEDVLWDENNHFSVFFNERTREVKALRTYGQHYLDYTKCLFTTEWIPLSTSILCSTPEQLNDKIDSVMKALMNFKESIKSVDNPMVVIDYLMADDYIVYSFNDDKRMIIYDYKSYREYDFSFSDENINKNDDIKSNVGYQVITMPSRLMDAMGIHINTERMHYRSSLKWENRPLKNPIKCDKRYSDVYNKALNIINYYATNETEQVVDLCRLEMRITRFEKLNVDKAPAFILNSEINLIEKAMSAFMR